MSVTNGSPNSPQEEHLSYSSSSSTSRKRKLHETGGKTATLGEDATNDDEEDQQIVLKRQRNTMAARKYRQKRLDRIAELEKSLEDVTGERDDLKLQLARREAEVEALREMLGRK